VNSVAATCAPRPAGDQFQQPIEQAREDEMTPDRNERQPAKARRTPLLLATVALVALSACSTTHLSGYQSNVTDPAQPVTGIGYALPATVFKITVTHKLVACEPEAEFETSATAVAEQVAGEHIVLDYRELASSQKTSSLKLETYANGTLKSVNAEVEDHGPEVAGAILKSVASVVRVAAGLPPGGGDGKLSEPQAKSPLQCGDAGTKALAAIKTAKGNVRDLTSDLDTATEQVERLTTQKTLGTLADADKPKLNSALDALNAAEEKLENAKATLQKAIAAVAAEESFIWPDTARFASDTRKWPNGGIALLLPPGKEAIAKFHPLTDKTNTDWDSTLPVLVTLQPTRPQIASIVAGSVTPAPASDYGGLYYRMPGRGRIRVCSPPIDKDAVKKAGKAAEADERRKVPLPSEDQIIAATEKAKIDKRLELVNTACAGGARDATLVDTLVTVSQFGQLHVMPLRNGWGQNNVLSGSWREDGSPETLSYIEKKASAVATAKLVQDVVNQAAAIDKDARAKSAADKTSAAADKAAADKAELDALDRAISVAKKQKELNDAKEALAGTSPTQVGDAEKAVIEAETSIIKAKTVRLQAKLDLKALEAKASQP
jgi:hypothetical protein